jgi:prepilin-type processing-associated H-X9-DG protein
MPTCPSCAERISTSDKTCPYCGTRVKGGVKAKRKKSSGAPVVLIVVGVVFGLFVICGGVGLALLLPAVQQAREAARRSQCKNNLKQIGLALHIYHEQFGSFPPAYVADASGKPMHSWRVLILPFIDQQGLYNEYKFSEPWDGPNNSRLLSRMPPIYGCVSDPHAVGNTNTSYAAVFGPQCVFRGIEPVKIMDITDGASNTLIVAEASKAGIPWMKPEDIDVAKHPSIGDDSGFSSYHIGGVNALMCDGSVRFVPQSIDPQTLKALFTRDGKEVVAPF